MIPLLKGFVVHPDLPPENNVVRFALWDAVAESRGAARLVVIITNPIREICDEWLKLLRPGLRVTLAGVDWRLQQFRQYPAPPPVPTEATGYWPWPIWNIELELEH